MDEKQVVGFILNDSTNQTQQYITDASLDSLKAAQKDGCNFLVEYLDGTRETILPEDIDYSLLEHTQTINIVQQEVFVPMMNAMLDLMEESMTPAVALLSVSGQKKSVTSKFDVFKSLVEDMNDRYLPNIEGSESE